MLEPPAPRVANRWQRSIILPGAITWLIMALALAWTFSPDPWLVAPPDPDSQLRLVQVREDVLTRSSGAGAYPDNETCLCQEVVTRLQKPVRQQRISEVSH